MLLIVCRLTVTVALKAALVKKTLKSSLVHTFAKNVHALRIKAGLSQEDLAELVKLHRTYIGSIERAERNVGLRNVEKLARALKVHPRVLLCEKLERKCKDASE